MGLKGNERPSFPFPKNLGRLSLGWQPSPQGHAGHGVDLPPAVAAAFAAPSGATPVRWAVGMGSSGSSWMKFLACLSFFICHNTLYLQVFVNTWFLLVMRRVFWKQKMSHFRNWKERETKNAYLKIHLMCWFWPEASALTPEEQRAPFGSSATFGHFSKDPKNRVANDSNILTYFQKLGLLIYFRVRSCLPTQVGKHTRINKGVSSFNSSKNHVSPWRMQLI